ncbi:Ig-like domain-containing protein [Holdemanella biformis]|uniref:Ig-like domain-containing protein n=1 Tax=Holdemanella biformis TaxID=1735 RepID=UPI003AB1F67A
MSLSKIGKLTSAFSSFKNNPLDLTNMATALASVGNVDNAAKYLVKINKQNGNFLGENAMAVLLSKAYRSSGINQEMAMGSINNALANSSKFSMGGMLGSLSAVGTGIATMFESIAPVIIPLIIAAVAAKAGKMAWDNFATNTAAKKQYQTSSKAYQEAASERDSVQSEYDSNKERIQELRAKANRTVDESKELSNLQSQNDLLNSQLSVKNQIADTAQKQAALDAKTALEKGSYRSGGLLNMDYDSDLEHASQLIKEIKEAQSEKAEIEANRSSYDDSYWSDYQKEERDIAKYDKDITNKKSDLSDLMTTISDTSQDFWDEQGNLVDESTRDTANKVKKLANDYTSITGVSDIDSKMNNLFARSQFKDVKDQLLDIGKKQGSKGIESKINEIDGLKSALDDAGISVDDFTSELMAMADPDAKNLEGIKENLKDIFGEIKDADGNSLYDFFKDKSNKDIEGYYDYFLNQGLNPQTSDYTWKKEDIENSYNDYLKSKETIEAESSTFSSKFKNSAEDTATDLDTITDNFQTDMSNIKSSMDSIKSGTFQNSDITDLIQQFPELATETDNLQQGLQNLAFDKASDAIGKIRDSVKDVTDPKQLAAADKYVQSIMDTMDLSGFDMSNAKSAILGNLTKNLADKHMASVTTPNLVNQLMSEYGNDEIAVQAIMKLSLDPSMANADLDTWKSKIEDTKVQIQLDTSAKNLDNLSKELTRLQTDASDQQTRLNNKSAYNMKATASDYTNLIKNGDKQIENLNKQIQEYQTSIDTLRKSKGLSPLSDEDNEQIKQYQDQIQAANMSIENMKASQADWRKTAFNLPVTDMQNTVTALTSAISEMQTETGLTSDTMDSLRTQFSDLKDAHVDNVFDRTAKGLKINTERMKDYLEQQNEFMNSDFAQRIQDYQDQLSAGNKDYTQQGLENLKNLQAQYFAQYQEAAKQFSDFQAMVNADNLSTEGNEYTTAKSYLDNAKDLYDKGLVGTPQFKAAAKYFSQNGFEDADNFIENYNKLKNYYTDDASGPKRFLSDLEAKGLATYKTLEDGNQQWMYSFTDTQEAADAMGMSLESFESMFGRLKDYGDTNNFVSSLEEGALKSEEIDDKLIDAQIKMGKLKASGANQSALDDQQAVIDNLIAQKTGITQAISDFKDGTVDRKIQDIKDAKGSIDELNQYIKDNGIDKDSDFGKKCIESIQEQAKKTGIKLTPEFEVDEAAYNKMIQGYEAKAKGQKIKHFQDVNEGIESGNTGDYTDSDVELVNKIKDAQDKKSDNYKQLQDLIQTLNKENPADLAQIQLGNGAYESEDAGIRGAEDALQGFADQLDLTQEQANALLTVLQALGEVKVQPEMSEELKEMQKNKGSVDLAHRPVIDASELSDMGYQNVGDGTATVFSSGYSTDDGKKTVVVTPILPNGDVLEPEALDHYANEILETGKDTQGIGIRTFEGDDSIQQANNYAEMLHQVQQAYYGEDEAAKQSLETLKDYSAQELMNIDYTDGQYSDNERYANAEKSVDSLIDSYKQMGMSEMEAQAAAESLIMVMDDMGLLKVTPEVDTSGIDELDQATQDGMASLRQMKADGDIDLSFEIDSDTDGLSIDELQSQIDELEKAKVKLKLDVDSPEYNAIQSMIDQRETQIHLQVLMDQSTDIDKWLALANGEDGDKQLAIAAGIDLNDEDAQSKIDALKASLKSLSGDTPAISVKIDETQFQALTKEQQGQGTVTFKPEHKEVDAYLAEEKKSDGKVKWSNETGLVDVYAATEHYSHGTVHWGNDISAVQTSFTATGTVNWINSGGPSGGLSKEVKLSSGTFKAESTGSAYNVLNITPAHASGTNVAIKQDQQALVNEVGINGHAESIVRDGVWSLIPGGAHIENLKKGDIIFSTTQTDALLKHGAIQGHARAYASGTVTSPGVMKAYAAAGNTPGFHFQGGAATVKPAGSGNSGNSGNSGLQHAIEDNTDAVSNNSDDTSDAADEVSEALQNVIKKLNDNAMDWVEVAMDRLDRITSRYTDLAESDYSHYTKAQKYYNKALENTDKEIKAAKESISVYKRKSEEVANNGEVSKYLTPALKKKVQDGTINIETLDANQKAAVEAYKQWYDKYLDAVQKYRDKKTQELDLAKSKVDNVYDSYDLIISKRKAKEEYYAAKAENRIKSGKSQKVGSVYWKDLKKQVSYAQYQKDWMLKERDKVQQSMTDYLNVNGHNKKDKAYQEMKKNLTDLNTSIVEADTHIQETKAALEETRENLKQWQIDRWERAGDKQDASLSYKKNADDINYQLSANDYEERLKTYDKIIRADEEKRQLLAEEIATKTWSNEETQKKIEEYDNLTASIIKSKEAMRQLAQEEIDFRFKPLDEAQNKLSNLVSEFQTAQKLLGDTESFYNDDGAFSTNGLTNILLVQEQIDATKDKIANYREGLNKLDEMYKNGAIGPEYYKTKTDEMLKSLQQESATLADLKQNLLDMYTTQVTKENDLLQENIEKRKDALSAKEKYYDYDKTLKKKTKDINALKAQIAALEGTSNAASKARLEKLRAELADAEDDMADTMHQHEVDMKNTGYENFSDEANKALDNTLDAVKKNAAFQEAIIGSMLSNVKANYDSTYKHLGDVMDQYGMKVSQTYSQMITKAADFNTAAVNATKAWEGVTKIDTSKPYGGSSAGNSAFDSAMNNAGSSQTAGSPNIKPDTDYTLKLSDTDIYLTYSHIKKQLKATWSPKKPEHSDIEWKSSDESIAKVSSDGTVRGVSSGLNKNGLMARDESKTRKCIITAIGGGGLAKATCTVHVMPDSHYEKIKDYADKAGIKETSGNNLRDAMEYAYKNGANHSNQSYTAVEGFKKAYLKDWTNSLPNRPDGATDVPAGVSPLIGYFNAKGKKVGPKEMQQLADILQINTPGVKKYDSWGSTLKNKILKAYKSYGFSKGGVVRKGIPANILDMIGGDALIPRGDSMLIGANPGETVLTKEFTDQLKPTVATLNEFNARMAKPITTILPSSSNDTSVNSECNITINVDKINNEQDIKKLAYQIGDIITERNKRDWKKVR